MASIPDVELKLSQSSDHKETEMSQNTTVVEPKVMVEPVQEIHSTSKVNETKSKVENTADEQDNLSGVKACDDTRYRKYFKMLQFGVPPPAVKIKIKNEGFDPDVLE